MTFRWLATASPRYLRLPGCGVYHGASLADHAGHLTVAERPGCDVPVAHDRVRLHDILDLPFVILDIDIVFPQVFHGAGEDLLLDYPDGAFGVLLLVDVVDVGPGVALPRAAQAGLGRPGLVGLTRPGAPAAELARHVLESPYRH